MFRRQRLARPRGKYGRKLKAAFARPGGEALRRTHRRDEQPGVPGLIRCPATRRASRLRRGRPARRSPALEDVPDDELPGLLADLGGHDIARAARPLRPGQGEHRPRRRSSSPTPSRAGACRSPATRSNHSALLTDGQIDELRASSASPADDRGRLPGRLAARAGSAASAERLRGVASRCRRAARSARRDPGRRSGRAPRRDGSTQEAFGAAADRDAGACPASASGS